MAPHSSTLAWKIPWMEEPGRLQSMRSLRVGHDWLTSLLLFTFMHWRRKWQPTPVFLPGESQGREPGGLLSMWSHRVKWLKWLSSQCGPIGLRNGLVLLISLVLPTLNGGIPPPPRIFWDKWYFLLAPEWLPQHTMPFMSQDWIPVRQFLSWPSHILGN